MRIRVTIDITKLMLQRKKLNLSFINPVWVRFSYKRLPDLCYCCGLLGHTHKDCSLWWVAKEHFESVGFPYGAWMKAEPYHRIKNLSTEHRIGQNRCKPPYMGVNGEAQNQSNMWRLYMQDKKWLSSPSKKGCGMSTLTLQLDKA